ncbi:hypothetical protein C8R44DRAFT_877097 [Mycena epipterygia]|nr:hypothetical protein C8R44DRAFT_877097 [Mycena epipterygia]
MSSPPSEPTLLSGDKHLLVQRGTGCEIWDFADGRRIWARDDILHSQVVAQPVHDGTGILITLCTGQALIFTLDPALMDCKLLVQVSILDLGTNSERSMPPIQLPPTFLDFSDPVIADGMWAANVTWLVQKADVVRYRGVLLVKWKERTFVLLDCPVELVHKRILSGHFLALTKDGATSDVVFYPSASLDSHWQPFDSPALAREAQSPIRIEPNILHQTTVARCTAGATSLPPTPPVSAAFLPTAQNPATSEPPTWEPISGGGTVDCVLIDSFTYSGYGLSFSCIARRQVPRRICRPTTRLGESTEECTWIVPLPEEHPSGVSLSPDTGLLHPFSKLMQYSAHVPERVSKSQLLVPHACKSGASRRAEVYPYHNDASTARRAPVTTPTTPGEPFAMPLAIYARLRARRRRPSRRRTPSRELVTRSALAAGASSVTPQNDAANVQHLFLTLRSRAPSAISNARSCRAGTLSSVAPRFKGLGRLRIIGGITSNT